MKADILLRKDQVDTKEDNKDILMLKKIDKTTNDGRNNAYMKESSGGRNHITRRNMKE